jgi:hypothetical protein
MMYSREPPPIMGVMSILGAKSPGLCWWTPIRRAVEREARMQALTATETTQYD